MSCHLNTYKICNSINGALVRFYKEKSVYKTIVYSTQGNYLFSKRKNITAGAVENGSANQAGRAGECGTTRHCQKAQGGILNKGQSILFFFLPSF